MADLRSTGASAGLTILDVSQIQRRVPLPQAPLVSQIKWDDVSLPQTAIPVTINNHRYLVEIDEFVRNAYNVLTYDPAQPVGAARIIDIANDWAPKVVSNIRLEVGLPNNRAGAEKNDPGA